MDSVFKLLLAWIVVLFILNKLLALRKPKTKTVKMLVKRGNRFIEVDAVKIENIQMNSVDDDFHNRDYTKFFSDMDPTSPDNMASPLYLLNDDYNVTFLNDDNHVTKL